MGLKKLASNTVELIVIVPPEDRACELLSFEDSSLSETKVLGMQWLPREDTFMYTFHPTNTVYEAWYVISDRTNDPRGLLSPAIFFAKTFMQRVWQAGLIWDEQLPPKIANERNNLINDLPNLLYVSVPQNIGTSKHAVFSMWFLRCVVRWLRGHSLFTRVRLVWFSIYFTFRCENKYGTVKIVDYTTSRAVRGSSVIEVDGSNENYIKSETPDCRRLRLIGFCNCLELAAVPTWVIQNFRVEPSIQNPVYKMVICNLVRMATIEDVSIYSIKLDEK